MTTPQAPSHASPIQDILAACGISVHATNLSELRLSVSYDTVGGKHRNTGPLKISTITVSIGEIGVSVAVTCTNGNQLLLCFDSSAATSLIFYTPDSNIGFNCQYTFSVVPMEDGMQAECSLATD